MLILTNEEANVNAEDKFGRTPLWMAAMLGRDDIVLELIQHGAKIDCCTETRTPLYIAVQYNRLKVVQVLLENGANIATPDKFGRKPVEVAHELGLFEMKSYLLNHGAVYEESKTQISMQVWLTGIVTSKIVTFCEVTENSQVWAFDRKGSVYVFSSKTNEFIGSISTLPVVNTFDISVVVVGQQVWCLVPGQIFILEYNKEVGAQTGDTKKENVKYVIEKKVLKLDQEVHTLFMVDNNMYGLVTPSSILVWSIKTYEVINKIQLFMSIFPRISDYQCRVSIPNSNKAIYISVRNIVYVFEDETFLNHYTLSGEADDIKTMVTTSTSVYTSGRFDFMLRIWDREDRTLIRCIDNAKYDLLFPICKDKFASNHLKTIKMWAKDFKPLGEIVTPHQNGISTLYCSNKTKKFWIAGNDNTISIWLF